MNTNKRVQLISKQHKRLASLFKVRNIGAPLLWCTFLSLVSSNIFSRPLTYKEIKALFLKGNVKVQLAKRDVGISLAEVKASYGEVEPVLFSSWFKEKVIEKTNYSLDNEIVTEETQGLSFGIKKNFLFGSEVEFSIQRLGIDSDSLNALLPKRVQLSSQIKYTQPFLKGLGKESSHEKIVSSKIKKKRYLSKLEDVFNKEYKEMIAHYLDAYKKQEILKINEETIKYFNELKQFTTKSIKIGTKSKIEDLEATSKYYRKEAVLLKKRQEFNVALKKFKKSLVIETEELSELHGLENPKKEWFTFKGKYKELPSLSVLRHKKSEEEVSMRKARNNLLPELNLELTLSSNTIGSSGDSLYGDIASHKYPTLEIALLFNWSLESNSAQGTYNSSLSKLHSINEEINLIQHERKGSLETLNFKNNRYNKLLEHSKQNIIIAKKKLEFNTLSFKQGKIGLLDSMEIQKDLEERKIERLKIEIEYFENLNDIAFESGLYVSIANKHFKEKNLYYER